MNNTLMVHHCTGIEFAHFTPDNYNAVCFVLEQKSAEDKQIYCGVEFTLFDLPTEDCVVLVNALKKLDANRKKRLAAKRAREDEPNDERVREALGLPPLYHDDTPSLDTSFHDHEMNV